MDLVMSSGDGQSTLGRDSVGARTGYERSKRLIDFVVALVALAVLSPLLTLIALGVRIDSRGPVIFRQERIGKRGNPFIFYKFRFRATHPYVCDG